MALPQKLHHSLQNSDSIQLPVCSYLISGLCALQALVLPVPNLENLPIQEGMPPHTHHTHPFLA